MQKTPPNTSTEGAEMPLFPNIHKQSKANETFKNRDNGVNIKLTTIKSPFAIMPMEFEAVDNWMNREDWFTIPHLHLYRNLELRIKSISVAHMHDMTVLGFNLMSQYN